MEGAKCRNKEEKLTKSAIVTGASSGIGLETSKHLVKDGWKVFGIDINYENKVALGEL